MLLMHVVDASNEYRRAGLAVRVLELLEHLGFDARFRT
jgi:hypothetical protein